ncbi:MAG: Cold shock protein of CSP family, partial [uncultured Gemmatimonadetes bacterium]
AQHRHRQVVQRRQGLRLHHPRGRREGLLRPLLRHRGAGLPHARRGRPGGVQARERRKGPGRGGGGARGGEGL